MRRLLRALVLAPVAAVNLTGCGGSSAPQPPATSVPASIQVMSDAVAGGRLQRDYTCDGAGEAPAIRWSGVPPRAAALAVVVSDPDAPGGTFYHWVVLDLPPTASRLDGTSRATEATNSGGGTAYEPACPPSGTHHYRFTVYALSEPTGLGQGASLGAAIKAIGGRAIARGTLTAAYTRG